MIKSTSAGDKIVIKKNSVFTLFMIEMVCLCAE